MNTFKNKDGQLSQYAFACGYVQDYEQGEKKVQLYHEGAVYQVRYFDRSKDFSKDFNDPDGGRFWHSFESLVEARKCFICYKKDIIKERNNHALGI